MQVDLARSQSGADLAASVERVDPLRELRGDADGPLWVKGTVSFKVVGQRGTPPSSIGTSISPAHCPKADEAAECWRANALVPKREKTTTSRQGRFKETNAGL